MRVAVLVSGSGTNLQALIDARSKWQSYEIVLAASNNNAAKALERAAVVKIDTAVIHDPADARAMIDMFASYGVDLVVLAGYLKLIPKEVIGAFKGRMINIHPALLPSFGGSGMYGLSVHRAVIESGATVSGATVHVVDEEYDHGRILAQWPVPVHSDDTPESLQQRVLAVEHELLPTVVGMAGRVGDIAALNIEATAFSGTDSGNLESTLSDRCLEL